MLGKIVLAILIIAAVAVGGVFFKDYLAESSAAGSLRAQIKNDNNVALTLSRQDQALQAEINDINAKSTQVLSDISTAKQVIPPKTDPNGIVENVINLGNQQQVTVIPLDTQPWTSVKVGKDSYQVFRMTVQVDGAQDHLESFVKALQGLQNQPLIIDNLSLSKPVATPTPTPTPSPTVTPVVNTTITVDTNDATSVLTTMATLNGNLTSLGTDSSVAVSFQYGQTLMYGGETQATDMTAPGLFAAEIGHLTAGVTYHFRAKVVGSSTVYGNDLYFTTPLTPAPTPVPEDTSLSLSLSIYAQ